MQIRTEEIIENRIKEDGALNANFETVLMTPSMAQKILDQQAPGWNRTLREIRVQNLVRIIETGRWIPGLSSIYMTADGRVLNGQHQLNAIVASGRQVLVRICTDARVEWLPYFDNNASRTTQQTLAMSGYKTSSREVAAANVLSVLEAVAASEELKNLNFKRLTLDAEEVQEFLKKYEDNLQQTSDVIAFKKAASIWGALAFAYGKYPEAVKEAIVYLRDGQVTKPFLRKFIRRRDQALAAGLTGASGWVEGMVLALELVKSFIVNKSVKIKNTPEDQQQLVRFFTKVSAGVGSGGLITIRRNRESNRVST